MEPRIRKELGLDEPTPPLTWKERAVVVAVEVIRNMPWIAAVVIGAVVSCFDINELRHPFWPAILLDLGVPLLLAGLVFLLSDGSRGRRTDYGVCCGFVLVLFLVAWPTFIKAKEKTIKSRTFSYQGASAQSLSAKNRH